MSITLRDYQVDLIDRTRFAFQKGKKAPLLVSPVGSGKTVMFSAFSKMTYEKNNSVLILAHRDELVEQISNTLKMFNVPHGFCAAGYPKSNEQITVGSVMTVYRRMGSFPKPSLIINDEAHHLSEGSVWNKVLKYYNTKVIGLTATPTRLGREPLGKVFDDLIVGPTIKQLINLGHLSKFKMFAPTNIDLTGVRISRGDYDNAQLDHAVNKSSITGSAIAEYNKYSPGKRAVVFCVSIQHSLNVCAQFNASGIPSAHLDGTIDKEQRRSIIKQFREGTIKVLTNCSIVSEGFDLPAIETVILLRPTQSLSLYIQQCGRGLRVFPGKQHAIILDHVGNVARFGLPDEEHEWSLEVNSKPNPKQQAVIKVCQNCYAAIPARSQSCPECQYVMQAKPRQTLTEQAGELSEINYELFVQHRLKQIEAKKKKTFDDYYEIGQLKKVKDPQKYAENNYEIELAVNLRGKYGKRKGYFK